MGQKERLQQQEVVGQVHNQAELPVHGTVANPVEEDFGSPSHLGSNILQE